MAELTIKEWAKTVSMPVDVLLEKFKEAGIDITDPEQKISDAEKTTLIQHLKSGPSGGDTAGKITLKKRKMDIGAGSSKKVRVTVRKKRTLVKPAEVAPQEDVASKKASDTEVSKKKPAEKAPPAEKTEKPAAKEKKTQVKSLVSDNLKMPERRRQRKKGKAGAEDVKNKKWSDSSDLSALGQKGSGGGCLA